MRWTRKRVPFSCVTRVVVFVVVLANIVTWMTVKRFKIGTNTLFVEIKFFNNSAASPSMRVTWLVRRFSPARVVSRLANRFTIVRRIDVTRICAIGKPKSAVNIISLETGGGCCD